MQLKQISTILNNSIMKNAIPEGSSFTQIAEDLSNIVELGQLVTEWTADTFKNFQQNLAVQIRTIVLTELLERKDFAMLKDSIEYGGAIQRVMATNLYSATDNVTMNPQPNVDYLDGKFRGTNISSKVYTEIKAFDVEYSISTTMWKHAFDSVEGVTKIVSIIYNTERNTITAELNELSKRIIVQMIIKASEGGRVIHLLSTFNTLLGRGTTTKPNYTLAEIREDRLLFAHFSDYVKSVQNKLSEYVRTINKKYNDGSVINFTPADRIQTVMLVDFATDIKFIGDPVDFNIPTAGGRFELTDSWQTTGLGILPTFADVSKIMYVDSDEETQTLTNIVGVVYDIDTCGILNVQDSVTSMYVAKGDFNTYYHHLANEYFYDSRLGSVVLALD